MAPTDRIPSAAPRRALPRRLTAPPRSRSVRRRRQRNGAAGVRGSRIPNGPSIAHPNGPSIARPSGRIAHPSGRSTRIEGNAASVSGSAGPATNRRPAASARHRSRRRADSRPSRSRRRGDSRPSRSSPHRLRPVGRGREDRHGRPTLRAAPITGPSRARSHRLPMKRPNHRPVADGRRRKHPPGRGRRRRPTGAPIPPPTAPYPTSRGRRPSSPAAPSAVAHVDWPPTPARRASTRYGRHGPMYGTSGPPRRWLRVDATAHRPIRDGRQSRRRASVAPAIRLPTAPPPTRPPTTGPAGADVGRRNPTTSSPAAVGLPTSRLGPRSRHRLWTRPRCHRR
jgi:hypothetical protein